MQSGKHHWFAPTLRFDSDSNVSSVPTGTLNIMFRLEHFDDMFRLEHYGDVFQSEH